MSTVADCMPSYEEAALDLSHGHELIVDLFAGAGGASLGIEAGTGRPVDLAINHSEAAIRMHRLNHPKTQHFNEDIWQVEPIGATQGRPVGLLWASPSCTHFSRARGGKPVRRQERSLAWVVIKWAQQVSPRVIIMENVEEFMTWGPVGGDNQPIKARAGEYFRRWVSQLRKAGPGYQVEWKVLNAADYGVPTARRRWFLVARCDGDPIVWPAATHAPADKAGGLGLKPYRTAAECIDWSLPCPSIFMTREEASEYQKATGQRVNRPLKPNTLRRIANGVMRYVVNAKQPFIVRTGHYSNVTGDGSRFRGQHMDRPVGTVTASANDKALVVPYLAMMQHGSAAHGCVPINVPAPTVTSYPKGGGFALVATSIVQVNHAGNEGRNKGADEPLGAVTATQRSHALLVANLLKNNAGSNGASVEGPLSTITTGEQHGVVATFLAKNYGGAGGNPTGLVMGFLQQYYSQGSGLGGIDLVKPAPTVTTKDRTGLVTVQVDGQTMAVVDIGMRMLQPAELLRAQFGRFADKYKLIGSKAQQVSGIGNSVPPEVAEALVRSNVIIRRVLPGGLMVA